MISWSMNGGGQTTAAVRGATHCSMTPDDARFSPASGVPGGARSRPPPLASEPFGILAWTAARATSADFVERAAGSTRVSTA